MASWLVLSTLDQVLQFEPWLGTFFFWLGTLCCVLGQDTLLSQCLSPPRDINGTSEFNGVE